MNRTKWRKNTETFNTFFTNIVFNLKIPPYQDTDFVRGMGPVVGDDSITFILGKYKKHPSIIAIKKLAMKTTLSILKL